MKKVKKIMILSMFVLLFVTGCSSKKDEEDIFQHDGTYIGDNSTVVEIIGKLKHGEDFEKLALETTTEPYGMTITYNEFDATMIDKEYKETAIYNATFLLVLIENAEWIAFDFENGDYKITRDELQTWYGEELSEIANKEDLESLIQEHLANEEKVNRLLG